MRTHFLIPYDWTSLDAEVQRELSTQRTKSPTARGEPSPWLDFTGNYPSRDFLGDLHCTGILPADADWARLTDLRDITDTERQIVVHTTNRLTSSLEQRLVRLVGSGISRVGGLLYYTDRIDRCLVFEYKIASEETAAKVTPLAQIAGPDVLYDVSSAIAGASYSTRAALKNALVFGHKIVAHRNTIVHVDRRRDQGVAGPFIDTLILNEILHKYIYECPTAFDIQTAVEVGCGSGMLVCSCAQNLPGLKQVFAIDTEIGAIDCTHRNFANAQLGGMKQELISICAPYGTVALSKVELALCNPPYIPTYPGRPSARKSAIEGTELMTQLLTSLPALLSNRGYLFMVFSRLARNEFLDAVKAAGLKYEYLGPEHGFPVQFDQSEVLNDRKWVDFLMTRGLEFHHPTQGWKHVLDCVAVHRSTEQGFVGTSSLNRIKDLNKEFRSKSTGQEFTNA